MNVLVRYLYLAFLLAACTTAKAATITAASVASSDVQAALNLAKAGDTVLIPAGSANWTQGVSLSGRPNVTVKGAGTSVTGGGDQTVITDNISGASNLKVMDLQGIARLSGITVRSGTGTVKDGGTIRIGGTTSVRVDHCHFIMASSANYQVIQFGSGVHGVMDHCIVELDGLNGLYFYNGRLGGGGDQQGNYEWTLPTDFGSASYFYIEDNLFINNEAGRIWDGFTAAKVVVRFNTVRNGGLSESHATGHSPDDRGTRSQEVYGNLVTTDLQAIGPSFAGVDISSGTGLAWGNSWDGAYKHCVIFNVTRKSNATYGQTATPNGWGYAGTAFNGTGSKWDGGTFNGTDTTLGYPCLDQPGRGAGDLLVGLHPNKVNNSTGTIRWPNQALEPIYLWNNTGTFAPSWGGNLLYNNTGGRMVANRDYYTQASGIQTSPTSPFNGTSGTGWGTLANRPTTCTPGVAYWAIDQGNWNTSSSNPYGVQQNGADGVLYKCTAPNTWTLYYTPYTYPHPLQTGGASNPNSPPTISADPANLEQSVGTAATFSVSANGSSPLSYQWQKNSANISGAVTATYAIPSVTTTDGGNYRCIVSNPYGTATSAAAVLTVTSPVSPTIVANPVNLNRVVGTSATFTVSAGGSAPLSYQWQKNGANIAGAVGATYTIPSVILSDAGDYRCRVTNPQGTATSAAAVLTVTTTPFPPLPEGDNGIAARWPSDAGVASDPAVIFADDFESYGSSAGLTARWSQAYPAANLRIATESGNFFWGSKALQFTVPQQNAEGSATVAKLLSPEQDVLFLRYYAKIDAGYDVVGSSHNGSGISSHYSTPGEPADGYNKFMVNYETARFDTTLANPGKLGVYIYHPDQRDLWGDFFFPTGEVSPFTAVPGDFGPGFVSRPNVIPQLGKWYCYEMMVKANTPGQRDGRIALWLDGNLIADFQNLRLRETSTLMIDKFDLGLYIYRNPSSVARKWYDNVVAAKSYIGPMRAVTLPNAPTGLRVVP